jgi:hypothetical protein
MSANQVKTENIRRLGAIRSRLDGLLTLSLLLSSAVCVSAAVRYVDASSANPTPPYTNWATAAHVIRDAVDAAVAGDEIVVTNGLYASGGRAVGTNLLVNRVAVDKPLTLRSVNGPEVTIIQGHQVPSTTNGDGAIRCVYLANGASLVGFTLTNGATRATGDNREQFGGGAWGESTNVMISNCVVVANSASGSGGGVYCGALDHCMLTGNSANGGGGAAECTLNHCTLSDNVAVFGGGVTLSTLNNCTVAGNSAHSGVIWVGMGGGAADSTLNNCMVTGNSVDYYGGGAVGSTLNNCTVIGNTADYFGAGAYASTLNNCIVYFNTAADQTNYSFSTLNYCCTAPMPTNGVGNITTPPLFVDHPGGNLRLQSNSPCINAGNNAYAPDPTDLDGNPRVVSGTVDIGAYEFQGSGSLISYAWLQGYGLPTDGAADFADPDADGHTTWQEWRCQTDPTNEASALRLLSVSSVSRNITVSWQSVNGVSYFLERATNLAVSSPFTLVATNLLGKPGTTSYTETNVASLTPVFYRVGVLAP